MEVLAKRLNITVTEVGLGKEVVHVLGNAGHVTERRNIVDDD